MSGSRYLRRRDPQMPHQFNGRGCLPRFQGLIHETHVCMIDPEGMEAEAQQILVSFLRWLFTSPRPGSAGPPTAEWRSGCHTPRSEAGRVREDLRCFRPESLRTSRIPLWTRTGLSVRTTSRWAWADLRRRGGPQWLHYGIRHLHEAFESGAEGPGVCVRGKRAGRDHPEARSSPPRASTPAPPARARLFPAQGRGRVLACLVRPWTSWMSHRGS